MPHRPGNAGHRRGGGGTGGTGAPPPPPPDPYGGAGPRPPQEGIPPGYGYGLTPDDAGGMYWALYRVPDASGGGGGGADPAALAESRYEADLRSSTDRYLGELAGRIDQQISGRQSRTQQWVAQLQARTDRYGVDVGASTSRYGTDVGAATQRYGADLDYQMGLKQLEVDWANQGLNRDRVDIERQLAAVEEGELAEMTRSNMAQEQQAARQRALDASVSAVNAYLEGSRLADQRRLSAFQESRALLPFMVPEGQEYQAGMEPGGALAQSFGNLGMNFTPQRLPTTRLDPSQLANAPSDAQIGSGILGGIQGIQQAGAV